MDEPTLEEQTRFWNDWVARSSAWEANPDNQRRAACVMREVAAHPVAETRILDLGCGTGWLALELARHGEVTAVDLAKDVIEALQPKHPHIRWIAGDVLSLALPELHFDVVTSLETIAHVSDQPAFAARVGRLLKPGGLLVLTTQNAWVWTRTSTLAPPQRGQLRDWPSRARLAELFAPQFEIRTLTTCAPGGDLGLPRLVNNRRLATVAARVLGRERWIRMREQWGFGRSLVLIASRRDSSFTGFLHSAGPGGG